MPEVNPTAKLALVHVEESRPVALRKRRSCDLVQTPSPCVKKALFHLGRLKELLRVALEKPEVDFERLSDRDAQRYIYNHPKGWKQLRFEIQQRPQTDERVDSGLSNEDKQLAITGIGGQANDFERGDGEKSVHVSQLEKQNQLTPYEVFSQVRELILRLEEDRRQTEIALERENDRVETLVERIDEMCQKRLIQLPLAVQREHDTCSKDISELQWHVGYMERQLERSKQRVEVAEVLNKQLTNDVAFVKKHCPLVEEKLFLEKDAMQKIKKMQKQADKEFAGAKIELEKVTTQYQEASESAEIEQKMTHAKLEGVRGQVNLLKKDLQHSKAMHTAYIKKSEQNRQKLAEQETELEALQKRAEEAKEEEQEEVYRIEDLQQKIKDVEFQTGKVNKQKMTVESEIEELHKEMRSKVAELETSYHSSLQKLRKTQEENREMKFDIEDMREEIKSCDKSIAKCTKEVERFKGEKERCDVQLKEACAEMQRVTVVNNELKIQLQKEESKSQAIEEALKAQAEILRKRVTEEMRQRTLLETKKQANSQALMKGRAENKKKHSKITKTLKETEESVLKIQEDVEKLKKRHALTQTEVKELEKELAKVKAEHEKEEKELTAERDILVPQERELMTTQMQLQGKIKELEFEEDQMTQKLRDLVVSKNAMEKRIKTTEVAIINLTEDLEEVNLRYEAGKSANEELQSQLDEATKRLAQRQKEHRELIDVRLKVKGNVEEGINKELERNRELAQRYRDLQSEYIDLKNKLMSLYDNKVKLETSIKDHKQLLGLQEKFNIALKQYYHDRGEFNKAGLQKFHTEAGDSSGQMGKVQKGLKKALTNISKFLQSQIEGGATNQVHEAAMKELTSDHSIMA